MALFSSNITGASRSLRVLARLLAYPDAQLRGALNDMRQALVAERALPTARLAELGALMSTLESGNALENEAEYVEVFDRGRATSLHLFEHVHGDSRDRGPAMIDLAQTYEKAGLFLGPDEMPDYLPVVLEFVSTQPPAEARAFLSEMAHIFNAIFSCLAAAQQCLRQRAGRVAGTQRRKSATGQGGARRAAGCLLGRTGGV
jgi:nitrate reductase delta subunit